MGVTHDEKEQAIRTAVRILGHPERERLLAVLARRIRTNAYSNQRERETDRMAFAIARSVVDQLKRRA